MFTDFFHDEQLSRKNDLIQELRAEAANQAKPAPK
jgi:hypothetical protein